MPDYIYFASLKNRYDLNLIQRKTEIVLFDAMSDLRYENIPARHDRHTVQQYFQSQRWNAESYLGLLRIGGIYDAHGLNRTAEPIAFDAKGYDYRDSVRWRHDLRILYYNGVSQTWDIIDDWVAPRRTSQTWRSDALVSVRTKHPLLYDAVLILNPTTRFSFVYEILRPYMERLPIFWDAIPCDFLAKHAIRFDSCRYEFAVLPIHKQSFVRPGWRIFARNLLTDEVRELGFIDADQRVLENVELPDGSYEISVLTSSLFWEDCHNHQIRTIFVGSDEEISPLPLIYNLRSAIQNGVTLIQWSALQSEVEDCLFGVWFSADSSVDTSRPPDTTVWYSAMMSEYQTTFEQNAPAWVAVAAIRPGNETEMGKVHELYLDWSNVPPRAPDDVMILPELLSAVDSRVYGDNDVTLEMP